MSTLSKPYYNANRVGLDTPSESSEGSFKVLKSSLETPYDVAKRRQSQLPSSQEPTITESSTTQLHQIDTYELDSERKRADYHIKLVVVGDGGCGKTCLLISYSQGEFPTAYVPTIFENYITNVTGSQGKRIELALWDTAGQEEYDRLRPLSYPDVNVLLVCYAVNNIISLQNVRDKWAPEVRHFCPGVPIIVVGTKADLLQTGEAISDAVSFNDADKLAKEIGAMQHIRCSAKTTENVNQIFNVAITTAMKSFYEEVEPTSINPFKKKAAKRLSRIEKSEVVSDYYKNSEYDMTDVVSPPKRRGIRRRMKCVIL